MSVLDELNGSDALDRMLVALSAVVGIVNDPQGAAARLKELGKATTEANERLEAAKVATAESNKLLADHTAAITSERAAHEQGMEAARKKFGADVAASEKSRAILQREAEGQRAQAKQDADAAAKLKAELESRLEQIRKAAA